MTFKTTLAALILALSPGMALAYGCSGAMQDRTASACTDGEVFDAESGACIAPTTS